MMKFQVDVNCNECGPVTVDPSSAVVVNVKDGFHPEEKGACGYFMLSCVCPNCQPGKPVHQIYDRIDADTRTMLRHFGTRFIDFYPAEQGNIPEQTSRIKRWLGSNRNKTWEANKPKKVIARIDAGDDRARAELDQEMDHDLLDVVRESHRPRCNWAPDLEELRKKRSTRPSVGSNVQHSGGSEAVTPARKINTREVSVTVKFDSHALPELLKRMSYRNN